MTKNAVRATTLARKSRGLKVCLQGWPQPVNNIGTALRGDFRADTLSAPGLLFVWPRVIFGL